jgi:hypothetical protein
MTRQPPRQNRGPVFVVRLRSIRPNSDGIRGLRWVLKILLRRFGFVCIDAREEQSSTPKMESSNV